MTTSGGPYSVPSGRAPVGVNDVARAEKALRRKKAEDWQPTPSRRLRMTLLDRVIALLDVDGPIVQRRGDHSAGLFAAEGLNSSSARTSVTCGANL
jgi:ClpP class serine protease